MSARASPALPWRWIDRAAREGGLTPAQWALLADTPERDGRGEFKPEIHRVDP